MARYNLTDKAGAAETLRKYLTCTPYSVGWFGAWLDLLNAAPTTAIRLRRRVAREWQTGSQRIRVAVYTDHGSYDGDYTVTLDSVDAFGWKAALKAARVLREEHGIKRYSRARLSLTDALIDDLIESEA